MECIFYCVVRYMIIRRAHVNVRLSACKCVRVLCKPNTFDLLFHLLCEDWCKCVVVSYESHKPVYGTLQNRWHSMVWERYIMRVEAKKRLWLSASLACNPNTFTYVSPTSSTFYVKSTSHSKLLYHDKSLSLIENYKPWMIKWPKPIGHSGCPAGQVRLTCLSTRRRILASRVDDFLNQWFKCAFVICGVFLALQRTFWNSERN